MGVRVMFLGPLRDQIGAEEMILPEPLTWRGLLGALPPSVSEALQDHRIRIACDGRLLPDNQQLAAPDGAEVALLPPVSGG